MENVMIDIQKAADIQNDAFTKAVEKERALEKERLKGKKGKLSLVGRKI